MPSDRPEANGAEESGLSDSLYRTVSALTDLLEKRLDLIELDVRATVSRFAQGGSLLIIGAVFAAISWVTLMCLAYMLIGERFSPAAGAGAVLAINALFAVIALAVGYRQISGGTRRVGREATS